MNKRCELSLCAGCLCLLITMPGGLLAQEEGERPDVTTPVGEPDPGRFMKLGTPGGELGGEEQKSFERGQIKTQILTFIPPLLRPAFTQHAYVLPPRAWSTSVSYRNTSLDGDDFFRNNDPNRPVFDAAEVDRNFTDFDLFYGFDLNRKYLHGFTARLNVPYLNSQTDGFVHPNGQPFIFVENAGSTSGIGDVGLFLKKKLWDQGTRPVGLAVVAAVFFPTGNNDDTFGSKGRITTQRPQPPPDNPATVTNENTAIAQGFDALIGQRMANAEWGDPRCFFRNFNLGNRAMCGGGAFGVPAGNAMMGPLSFADGGANAGNRFIGDFPFNSGIFGRFAGDGRLPSVLQPGTGEISFLLGGFLTRQFGPGRLPGRSAAHFGITHKFVKESDGIDFGDRTTFFASFVKPFYRDFIALDLSFVGFLQQEDSYSGKIPEPEIHTCDATDAAEGVGGLQMPGPCAEGQDFFVFELVDRPSFTEGFTGFVAPSLIFSPDPQIRITLSGLFRVVDPDLGPAPPWVLRAGIDVIF